MFLARSKRQALSYTITARLSSTSDMYVPFIRAIAKIKQTSRHTCDEILKITIAQTQTDIIQQK